MRGFSSTTWEDSKAKPVLSDKGPEDFPSLKNRNQGNHWHKIEQVVHRNCSEVPYNGEEAATVFETE